MQLYSYIWAIYLYVRIHKLTTVLLKLWPGCLFLSSNFSPWLLNKTSDYTRLAFISWSSESKFFWQWILMAAGDSRIADMVDTVHHEYGVLFVSIFRILCTWIKMLVFTKLTVIYTGIYEWYWYLHTILVFTCNTGICLRYWYLHTILVFTCDTGIYAQYYSTQQLVSHSQTTNFYRALSFAV